jgi:hypothetical protein
MKLRFKLRRRPWACTAILGVSLLPAAVAAPPAAAVVSQFGSKGTGAGQFIEPHGIAVDHQTGDVYVADQNNDRVESFGPEGAFRFAVGWGVSDGADELQICTAACRPGLPGDAAGQFSSPDGVAVDNDSSSPSYHDLYVVDSGNHRIQKLASSGSFLLLFGSKVNATTEGPVCLAGEECRAGSQGSGSGELQFPGGGLAVEAGRVYVGDLGRAVEFSEEGAPIGELALPEAGFITSLATDASGDLYVVGGEEFGGVHEYDSFGSEVGTPLDVGGNPRTVAVGAHEEVFIDNGEDVGFGQPHLVEFAHAGTELSSFDSGAEGGSRGIAYSGVTSRVYVLNAEMVRLVPLPPSGPLVVPGSEAATEVKPTTASVNASIDPEGSPTKYHFEYGTDSGYGASTAESEEAFGSLFEDGTASSQLTDLLPNTTYHFRVVATDEAGHTTLGPDATFTTLPPVAIDGESAAQVTSESARLDVELNPLGSPTSYVFEYGRQGAPYETTVPTPPANAGSGVSDVADGIVIEHLSPDTTYHYRVVAQNAFGTVEGPDKTFTTRGASSFSLADSRRWEMVSPPDKAGAAIESLTEEGGLIQAAESGDALTYIARGPINTEAPGSRSALDTQLLATRGASGWSTRDITPAHEAPVGVTPGQASEYTLFSTDLGIGEVEPIGNTPLSPAATERTPYLLEGSEYVPLITASNVPPGTKFGGTEFKPEEFGGSPRVAGASPDLSHVMVISPQVLTSDFAIPPEFANLEIPSIYDWHAGALALVSVLPDGRAAAEVGGKSDLGLTNDIVRHAVSQDGQRIVFTVSRESGVHLYLRDMRFPGSLQLDLPEDGESRVGSAEYQDASADGRKIFFTDEERLTAGSSAGNGFRDLYECEVREIAGALACALSDLSVPVHANEPAHVVGDVAGVDEAGRYVYFVADGALTADAVPSECDGHSEDAGCNLYSYDTDNREVRLIAVLSAKDFPDWSGGFPKDLGGLTARVSPNGRYLAFMSRASLTGYDNKDARSGARDQEVFMYDAQRKTLRCVSCDPTGARPQGVFDSETFPGLLVDRPRTWEGQWLAGSIPGYTRIRTTRAFYQSRYLTNDGRLFFDSGDGLVPQDVNGEQDVYEFEPDGVGSCNASEGCLALMSSGTSNQEAAFLDAGGEGQDVFFLTASQLSPRDDDRLLDVYDAHICAASSPCPTEATASSSSCASVDGCRTVQTLSDGLAGAAPAAVLGGGNLTSSRRTSSRVRPLTRSQLLSRALRRCRKARHRKRKRCEVLARRRYGYKHVVHKQLRTK